MSLPTPAQLEQVLVDATDREPDSQLIERPDWLQLHTPSSSLTHHNKIWRAQLPASDVAATIAKVKREHAARGANYRWVVGPSSRPTDLDRALADSGHSYMGPTLGMALPVPEQPPEQELTQLTIEPMGPQTVTKYAEVTAQGWERGPDFAEAVARIASKAITAGVPTRSWIASLDGEPVATSHLRLLPAAGYMQGCAVLPKFRRRGIYREMLHHRLRVLRALDLPVAVVWADADTSGAACRSLGFETVCSAEFYESTSS